VKVGLINNEVRRKEAHLMHRHQEEKQGKPLS